MDREHPARLSLRSWAASTQDHARMLDYALRKLSRTRMHPGGIVGHAPGLDEAYSRFLDELRIIPVGGDEVLDDSQAFLIQAPPFTYRNAARFVATFEGWLLWESHGAPATVLDTVNSDLLSIAQLSVTQVVSPNARPPAWILTSWGVTRCRRGMSLARLADDAALLEARFQLARYARVDVSVPGVA